MGSARSARGRPAPCDSAKASRITNQVSTIAVVMAERLSAVSAAPTASAPSAENRACTLGEAIAALAASPSFSTTGAGA